MADLLPCPFCGSAANLIETVREGVQDAVSCTSCDAMVEARDLYGDRPTECAIEAWNRREAIAQARAEARRQALEEAIEECGKRAHESYANPRLDDQIGDEAHACALAIRALLNKESEGT